MCLFFWEKLCREAIPFLQIEGITFNPAFRWWGSPVKDVELESDLVADSQDGKYLLVGECKWVDKPIHAGKYLAELEEKARLLPFARGKTIIPVLFLKHKPEDFQGKSVFFPEDVLLALK
jgi:hypothetical protein